MKTHYRFLVRWVPTDITLDDDCPTEEISSGGNKNVEKKKVKMDDCGVFFLVNNNLTVMMGSFL